MISFRVGAKDDVERDEFLSRFAANLPAFADQLGLDDRQVASLVNDAAIFQWAVDMHTHYRAYARDWMTNTKRLRDGLENMGEADFEIPQRPPTVIRPEGQPLPGVFRRIGCLIEQIKGLPNYTPAIGEVLGLDEAEWMIDGAWAKPYIKARRLANGLTEIVWDKFQYDGVLLEVDRDGAGFSLLGVGTVPNFIDTHPVASAGSDIVWKYRAMYQVGDGPVGQWSEIAQLTFPAAR